VAGVVDQGCSSRIPSLAVFVLERMPGGAAAGVMRGRLLFTSRLFRRAPVERAAAPASGDRLDLVMAAGLAGGPRARARASARGVRAPRPSRWVCARDGHDGAGDDEAAFRESDVQGAR
jgi:hypothetical protein